LLWQGNRTYVLGQPITGEFVTQNIHLILQSTDTYGSTNGMEYTNSGGQVVPDVHSISFV
ncbi:hypothetical protein, partial [Chryseobacterium wanjuense]